MFLYRKADGKACILECRGYGGEVRVPEQINGLEVNEVADYAFSAGRGHEEMMREAGGNLCASEDGGAFLETPGTMDLLPPSVIGDRLTEIFLPDTIRKIGKYAFYNCYYLQSVNCFSNVADQGAGIFTGCMKIRDITITIVDGQRSCFKEMLAELRQELYVNYYSEAGMTKLVFPEMYEESVENTPARIIMRQMHGCGHMYRYCFDGTKFCFSRYDALFPHVKAQEPKRLVTKLVMGRLRYPLGLSGQAEEIYEGYLQENIACAGMVCLEERDSEQFYWLAQRAAVTRPLFDVVMKLANEAGEKEIIGQLMALRHQRFTAKKRTFSL